MRFIAIIGFVLLFFQTSFGQSASDENNGFKAPIKNGIRLTNLQIPFTQVMSGGPVKNGIPALNYPSFLANHEIDYMQDDDEVLGITINGQSKAYPIKIMDWHEIINDKIDNTYFLMTYCPLCGSGVAFDAYVDGKPLVFRVSGLLYNSDVLLYDLQTESLWSQLMSQAVSGDYAGQSLEMLPMFQTTWADWKESFPEGQVMSIKTGHPRDYHTQAYDGYRSSGELMFPVENSSNELNRKDLVYGLDYASHVIAYPISELGKSEEPFTQVVAGETLYFNYDKLNQKLGVLDSKGQAIPTTKLYWFAWFAFHPDTGIYYYSK